MGYPSFNEELDVLSLQEKSHPIETLEPVIAKEDFIFLQREVQNVRADDSIKEYIVEIVQKTRQHPSVQLGVSPRGSIALMKAAQAYALLHHRDYVIPDDIQYLAPFTLPHRMMLHPEAKFEGIQAEAIVRGDHVSCEGAGSKVGGPLMNKKWQWLVYGWKLIILTLLTAAVFLMRCFRAALSAGFCFTRFSLLSCMPGCWPCIRSVLFRLQGKWIKHNCMRGTGWA